MKNTKKFFTGIVLIATLFGVKVVYSQSLEDATNAYNRGVELAATDSPKAIEALKEAAVIAEKAGDEGADIVNLSKQQIPVLQYNHATALYKDKKVE